MKINVLIGLIAFTLLSSVDVEAFGGCNEGDDGCLVIYPDPNDRIDEGSGGGGIIWPGGGSGEEGDSGGGNGSNGNNSNGGNGANNRDSSSNPPTAANSPSNPELSNPVECNNCKNPYEVAGVTLQYWATTGLPDGIHTVYFSFNNTVFAANLVVDNDFSYALDTNSMHIILTQTHPF